MLWDEWLILRNGSNQPRNYCIDWVIRNHVETEAYLPAPCGHELKSLPTTSQNLIHLIHIYRWIGPWTSAAPHGVVWMGRKWNWHSTPVMHWMCVTTSTPLWITLDTWNQEKKDWDWTFTDRFNLRRRAPSLLHCLSAFSPLLNQVSIPIPMARVRLDLDVESLTDLCPGNEGSRSCDLTTPCNDLHYTDMCPDSPVKGFVIKWVVQDGV